MFVQRVERWFISVSRICGRGIRYDRCCWYRVAFGGSWSAKSFAIAPVNDSGKDGGNCDVGIWNCLDGGG